MIAAHRRFSGGRPDPTEESRVIEQHLLRHAGRYWESRTGERAAVQLLRVDHRTTGRLLWYRVTLNSGVRNLVVKVMDLSHVSAERLRLAGLADPTDNFLREYNAVKKVHDHFATLADERLGHAPILDRIGENGAIVMEEVAGTQMSRLFLGHNRLRPQQSPDALLSAAHRAGAWLREFHSVPVAPTVIDRSDRNEFVDLVAVYCSYIDMRLKKPAYLSALSSSVRNAAERVLPYDLPVALAHGDFAMRNVIVQRSGRVLVLDTLARRHAPIYEDLATFLIGMRSGRLQLYTFGIAFAPTLLRAVELAVLDGYYGDSVQPTGHRKVYEMLVLLDRWAAALARNPADRLGRSPARYLANRWFERETRRAAALLESLPRTRGGATGTAHSCRATPE